MEVNGGNVDNEEEYKLLIEYTDCLLIIFKKKVKLFKLEELRSRFVDDIGYSMNLLTTNRKAGY